MLREVASRGGRGGGYGDLKEAWLGQCCWNPSILDLILFKAKCIKIATLSKTRNSKIEYFFEENLYYAERHIPSELNMEVTPPPRKKKEKKRLARVSISKLPREPFSIYGGEETMHLLMMTYRQIRLRAC